MQSPRLRDNRTYGFKLRNITLAFSNTRVCQGLDATVTNGKTSKNERVLNDEFENVGKGKESEVRVLGGEVLVQEGPDGSDYNPISYCSLIMLRGTYLQRRRYRASEAHPLVYQL